MSISRWDPWRDFISLREAMDRLFEESFVRPGFSWREGAREVSPMPLPLDVYSTDNELVIIASVPGVSPEDVDITIEGDTLTIKGELKPPVEGVDYVMQERRYGPFQRTLTLNIPVEVDKAKAEFKDGILTLTLPKAEVAKPKTIKVKAK